jgi:hypothetical protein
MANAAQMLFQTLGFGFAALKGLEEITLLVELVLGHVFLYPLQDAVLKDGAYDTGELRAFAHRFGEACAEGG